MEKIVYLTTLKNNVDIASRKDALGAVLKGTVKFY